MPWTDEMVESLKKMWEDGLSTGEIGKRLGVSKNSIVGKVHRLQLIARTSPIKKKDETAAAPEKNTSKAKAAPKPQPKPAAPKQEKKPQVSVAPKVEPKPEVKEEQVSTSKTKTTAPKAAKETEAYLNVSIPVIHSPKKPGDKITVTDLDNHTCRWPIGDPKDENFHFCGAPVKIGQTYCEEHAAVAYVKNIKK